MAGIYNYFVGTIIDFSPTPLLKHQKFLLTQQIVKSTLKLKDVKAELELMRKRDLNFVSLIKERKKIRRQCFINNKSKKF